MKTQMKTDRKGASRRGWRRKRWLGAIGGALLGTFDTLGAAALGVSFEIAGWNVSLFVLGFLACSFAVFGFMLGYLLELRQRERMASARVQAQLEVINEAQAKLVQNEKLASLGQLAAAIAHEVRNPLAIIRSSVQNLEETLPDGDREAEQACSFVIEEIDRLSKVTSSLLSFARPLEVERRPVSVHDLLERTHLLARRMLEERKVHLHRVVPAKLPTIAVDPDLTCQVLLGLLENAAQATPAGGAISLEAKTVGDGVELGVADSGPGVPEDIKSQIFDPFFTTRSGGNGLGLAVARQIVEAQGGHINVSDNVDGGARFTIQFSIDQVGKAAA